MQNPLTTLRELRAAVAALSPALRWSLIFYLIHVLVQGKVALSEAFGFFATLWLVWALAKREVRPSFHILFYPLALYGIASSASALINHSSIHFAGDAMTWVKLLIFPAALILFRTIPESRQAALLAQAVFAVGIALYGIAQYVALPAAERDSLEYRITGPSTHVMTYSGLLLPAGLMLIVLAFRWRNVWIAAAAAVVNLALLLTFTRSVWVGWSVAIISLLVVRWSRSGWRRPQWALYATAAALLFVSFMPEAMFARLASSFDLQQSSNLDRIRMAQAGVGIIADHPTFGVGPAGVKEIYPLYRLPDAPRFRPPHLHNNVIQLWAERGILGLAAYVLFFALFLRECVRGLSGPRGEFAEAGLAVAIGLTCAGLFEFNFGDTEVFYLTLEVFALMIAMLESVRQGSPLEAGTNELRRAVVPPAPSTV